MQLKSSRQLLNRKQRRTWMHDPISKSALGNRSPVGTGNMNLLFMAWVLWDSLPKQTSTLVFKTLCKNFTSSSDFLVQLTIKAALSILFTPKTPAHSWVTDYGVHRLCLQSAVSVTVRSEFFSIPMWTALSSVQDLSMHGESVSSLASLFWTSNRIRNCCPGQPEPFCLPNHSKRWKTY